MRIAITGGSGFVGGHLAERLAAAGHDVVVVARGVDQRPRALETAGKPGISVRRASVADAESLASTFEGCEAIAHCAGINREVGRQTYEAVHVVGTRNVVAAAAAAGVERIVLLSFLRARPDCGSAYHESKWQAEEIVRASSLQWTVLKPGMVYGAGDHFLDHLSHALHTFPVLLGRRVRMLRLPMAFHEILAWLSERLMTVPLVARAQVMMLREGIVDAVLAADALPGDLQPATPFDERTIRQALPPRGRFGRKDLRFVNDPTISVR